jgi:hypothetical protein
MYPHPIRAVIRETSTNADDARIEAGSGRPTEVTLPSKLHPLFTVRDYGIGMDYDTIVYIYSRYGASTKRNTNDLNGALGFGCKAPLAYTPQFTVVTVKDGLRNTISCGRKPTGGGTMTLAEKNVPTDEPNGTTVMVPVKSEDIDEFEAEAKRLYRTFKPGTILVNGEPPERIPSHMRLSPRFSVIKGDEHIIVMANVGYPVEAHYLRVGLQPGFCLLAEVPTGAVTFVNNREALEMNPATRAVLTQVGEDFQAACKGAIQKQIDSATDDADAMRKMVYWRRVLPATAQNRVRSTINGTITEQYTYKGAILPAYWQEVRHPGQEYPFLVSDIKSYVASRHEPSETVDASCFARDIFVLGFTPGKFTSSHKERLNLWRRDGNEDATADAKNYVCCRADAIPPHLTRWITKDNVISWEDVKANYKLPVNRSASTGLSYNGWKQVKGSYEDVWTENGDVPGETPAKDIRQDKPIYYFQTKQYNLQYAITALGLLHSEFTVVKLQANRVGKFCRDFDKAKPLIDGVTAAHKKWRASVTDDQLNARSFQKAARYGSRLALLEKLDASRINDPAIKEAIRLGKMDLTSLTSYESLFWTALHGGNLPDGTYTDPLTSYPLVTANATRDALTLAHTYLYINMVYSANNA